MGLLFGFSGVALWIWALLEAGGSYKGLCRTEEVLGVLGRSYWYGLHRYFQGPLFGMGTWDLGQLIFV